MQQICKNKWDIVCNWVGLSYRIPYIVGAKEVFIFLTMKYLSDNFRKNIYSNFECEHNIGKSGGC